VASGSSSPIVVTGLIDGINYYFEVAGVDGGGIGALSNEASAAAGPATVTVSAASVAYGNVAVGNSKALKEGVMVGNPVMFGVASISGANAGDFKTGVDTCSGRTYAAGKTCEILVSFTPGSAAGTAETAMLTFITGAGATLQTVPLSGTAAAPLSYSPGSINFGTISVGKTSAVKTVTLHNGTAATTLSLSITASGSGFTISGGSCGSSLAADSSCTVTLSFTPSASGAVTGSLGIADSPDNGSPYSLALTGTGK